MKQIICILIAALSFVFPAFAEENPFAPYAVTAPEGVVLEAGEGSHTFVAGTARVVVMVIDRVPDANPSEAVIRMMAQYEPDAVLESVLAAAPGFVAQTAVTAGQFGEGVDLLTVMVLSTQGDLLILSGYDMNGEEANVQNLINALLTTLTADGQLVFPTNE